MCTWNLDRFIKVLIISNLFTLIFRDSCLLVFYHYFFLYKSASTFICFIYTIFFVILLRNNTMYRVITNGRIVKKGKLLTV